MPWVDTINIKALTARVDEAIRKDEAVQAVARVDAFRKVDMTTMRLLKCSDEETQGEGDNGRAAQAIDSRSSTYWHSPIIISVKISVLEFCLIVFVLLRNVFLNS